MSDRNQELPSFELPPQPENPNQTGEQAADTSEQIVSSPEQTGSQAGKAAPTLQAPPQAPVQLQPLSQDPAAPTNIVVKDAPHASSSLPASDVDLIEKEWVDRAKNIVAHTQDDPFVQKNEISKVKAEYIQKRFRKSLPAQEAEA